MQGKPIAHGTLCTVGGHAFLWTSSGSESIEPHWSIGHTLRCSCGAYSWNEWQAEVGPPKEGM